MIGRDFKKRAEPFRFTSKQAFGIIGTFVALQVVALLLAMLCGSCE